MAWSLALDREDSLAASSLTLPGNLDEDTARVQPEASHRFARLVTLSALRCRPTLAGSRVEEGARQQQAAREPVGLLFLLAVAGDELEVRDRLDVADRVRQEEMRELVGDAAIDPARVVQRVVDD